MHSAQYNRISTDYIEKNGGSLVNGLQSNSKLMIVLLLYMHDRVSLTIIMLLYDSGP